MVRCACQDTPKLIDLEVCLHRECAFDLDMVEEGLEELREQCDSLGVTINLGDDGEEKDDDREGSAEVIAPGWWNVGSVVILGLLLWI